MNDRLFTALIIGFGVVPVALVVAALFWK